VICAMGAVAGRGIGRARQRRSNHALPRQPTIAFSYSATDPRRLLFARAAAAWIQSRPLAASTPAFFFFFLNQCARVVPLSSRGSLPSAPSSWKTAQTACIHEEPNHLMQMGLLLSHVWEDF